MVPAFFAPETWQIDQLHDKKDNRNADSAELEFPGSRRHNPYSIMHPLKF